VIAPETARRLGCDAEHLTSIERDGLPLSVGRRKRTVRIAGISRLYTLLRFPKVTAGLLELRISPGISGYAFTFG